MCQGKHKSFRTVLIKYRRHDAEPTGKGNLETVQLLEWRALPKLDRADTIARLASQAETGVAPAGCPVIHDLHRILCQGGVHGLDNIGGQFSSAHSK